VTRWRQQDLQRLGELCRLDVVAIGANQLLGAEIEHFWRLSNEIADALDERPLPGGAILPRALSFVYRKLGCRYLVPGMGTSLFACYQRRADEHD
jgi:hypothetical protein